MPPRLPRDIALLSRADPTPPEQHGERQQGVRAGWGLRAAAGGRPGAAAAEGKELCNAVRGERGMRERGKTPTRRRGWGVGRGGQRRRNRAGKGWKNRDGAPGGGRLGGVWKYFGVCRGKSSAEGSLCDSPRGLRRFGAGERGALRCGGSSMGERETDATFLAEEEPMAAADAVPRHSAAEPLSLPFWGPWGRGGLCRAGGGSVFPTRFRCGMGSLGSLCAALRSAFTRWSRAVLVGVGGFGGGWGVWGRRSSSCSELCITELSGAV